MQPPRDGDRRRGSALGIALLDATGLGVGHCVLERYLAGLLLLGGTLVAVAVGIVIPGPAGPIVIAIWLAASGIAGYLAARRRDFSGNAALAIGAGLAALLVIAGGYVLYIRSADDAYASALEHHRRGECSSALESYRSLDRFYGLSYRSFAHLDGYQRECRSLKRLDALPEESGLVGNTLYRNQAEGYAHLAAAPLVVEPVVLEHRQAVALSAWGDVGLQSARIDRSPAELVAAAEHYDRALTHEATYQKARTGVASIAAVLLRSPICERAHQAEALATGQFSSSMGAILKHDAGRAGPRYLLSCGRALISADPVKAAGVLKGALRAHPHSPQSGATRRYWIKAEVAAARQAGGGHLPPPSPSGSAPSGSTTLVVGNDSRYRIQVFLDGPRPSEFVVPACGSCSDYRNSPTSFSCTSAKPSHTVALKPGRYNVEVEATNVGSIKPFTSSWSLSSGVRYSHCLFVVVH